MGCAAQGTGPLHGVAALRRDRRDGGLILSLVLIATPALGEPLGDDVARVQEAEHLQRLAHQQAVTLSTEQFAQDARQQTLDRLAGLNAQGLPPTDNHLRSGLPEPVSGARILQVQGPMTQSIP